MTAQHRLTDPTALALHRQRATPDGLFLHHSARAEVQDRLSMVNKSFHEPAVVTGFPALWSDVAGPARVVADHDTLALQEGGHDLLIHAMGLHWANDPVGQLIQMRRALRPDGIMLAVAFGGQTLHELRACLAQAETMETGGLSPRIAPMAELRDLGGLLQRAGFALPVADNVTQQVAYRDVFHLMRDLRAMGETNALEARLRRPTRRAVLERTDALYRDHFGAEDGRILATFELIFLTGWAPDESQQKPLRPGSAQQRLADALGTGETKLRN